MAEETDRETPLRRIQALLAASLTLCLLAAPASARDRLTEPFLQNPGPGGVSVVWFTEEKGRAHHVRVGPEQRLVAAQTRRIDSLYEDAASHIAQQEGDGSLIPTPRPRRVWRHEARVTGLTPGLRTPYFVIDVLESGETRASDVYSLAPTPPPGAPLSILLTSDHQLAPMTAANIRKVAERFPRIDAVLFAGDLVNAPARASEWFDDARGRSFFDVLQGRARARLDLGSASAPRAMTYRGAALLQSAPLFPAIGNHEVMGRRAPGLSLAARYHSPAPRAAAARAYAAVRRAVNPLGDPAKRARWIEDASHNTRAYEDIFSLPSDGPGGERYYFARFGDVALISLFAARIWRPLEGREDRDGRYGERAEDLFRPGAWGHGAFLFEPIGRGSAQYAWLERTLRSEAFQSAPIKLVMLHHPPRGLGGNVGTPFAAPQPVLEPVQEPVQEPGPNGAPTALRYRYPKDQNPLIRDLEPLFIEHGVDLVLFGHSHLWQRMRLPGGPHYLESSNVGNSFGCFVGDRLRRAPPFDAENFMLSGDPYGLAPIPPSLFAPQSDEATGAPLPCVASNHLTVFSVLDTAARAVESYVYDIRAPGSPPRLFDRFTLD